MKVYLVRSIETKAFEGVFWAKSLADLWDTFDQFGDPYGYEYAALRASGAVCVGARSGVHIQQWDELGDDDDVEEVDWSIFQADEMLGAALHNQRDLKWKPFCASDEGYGLLARIAADIEECDAVSNDNQPVAAAQAA